MVRGGLRPAPAPAAGQDVRAAVQVLVVEGVGAAAEGGVVPVPAAGGRAAHALLPVVAAVVAVLELLERG